MRETVNLCKQTVKKPSGKQYVYWVLRWRDMAGKHHGKNIGRVGTMSKRQAEKLRQAKQVELSRNPRRRSVPRTPCLGEYLGLYYKARRGELAPGTMLLHKQTGRYLLAFFGDDRRLDSIERPDARAFKTALANNKLTTVNARQHKIGTATVNLHIRNARVIMGMAVEDELLLYNPFDRLAGTAPPPKQWHYVDMAEFAKIRKAAPDTWAVLLDLARYAALRRGEAMNLRWSNIDWKRSRLTVIGTDDWQVKDKDSRTVPLGPELRASLLQAFERAEKGAVNVIPAGSVKVKNISRDFTVLCRREGLTRYAKPLHTLRKSCITDWASRFPMHAVKEWAGHSSTETTNQYYLQVSEADYEAAAGQSFGVCT